MQAVLFGLDEIMAEKRVELIILERIEQEQGKINDRLDKIDDRLLSFSGDLGEIRGSLKPPFEAPWWLRFVVAPLCVAVLLSAGGALIRLHFVIAGIQKDLSDLPALKKSVADLHLSSAETMLDSAQKFAKAGQKADAAADVRQATESVKRLVVLRQLAPESFFQSAVQKINVLAGEDIPFGDINQSLIQLAAYRSALNPQHATGTIIKCPPGQPADILRHSTLFGAQGDQSKANRYVSGSTFIGCPQVLDGFTWTNVVFADALITYRGGPLVLNNVTFVNCRFITEINDAGSQFLQKVALNQNRLSIKPEFFVQPAPNGM